MNATAIRRTSRSGVAALAVSSLLSSLGVVSLLTLPAANAAATINDIRINEVESNGDTAHGDWIELYNNNATDSFNLAGVKLADNDNTHVITITSGTIPAGGYFTIRTDVTGPGTTGDFGLGSADSARLYAAGATVGTTTPIDTHSWPTHASTTYGRFPNGTGPFVTTSASTYNAANSYAGSVNPSPAPLIDKIVINEVESSGDATNGNWIELRNTTQAAINIGGAILSDNNNSHTLTIPTGTSIPAGGYKAFVVQDAAKVGPFGLGANDSARLFIAGTVDLATATPVDSLSWNSHSPATYGRVPNGTGAFTNTAAGTFGTANGAAGTVPTLAGVVINEVESNGDATNGDWIELYNTSNSSRVIAGAAISDADNAHTFTIPAGTPALASHAYIAFRVDDPLVDGNFGLGNVDSARLFTAGTRLFASATPVSSYSWTAHAGNTWGRIPNGTGSFVNTTAGSFGAPNS